MLPFEIAFPHQPERGKSSRKLSEASLLDREQEEQTLVAVCRRVGWKRKLKVSFEEAEQRHETGYDSHSVPAML